MSKVISQRRQSKIDLIANLNKAICISGYSTTEKDGSYVYDMLLPNNDHLVVTVKEDHSNCVIRYRQSIAHKVLNKGRIKR